MKKKIELKNYKKYFKNQLNYACIFQDNDASLNIKLQLTTNQVIGALIGGDLKSLHKDT